MKISSSEILELINKRRTVLEESARTSNREPHVISHPAREQLKNKRIKEYNNISRVECEDKPIPGVSDETRQLTLVTDHSYTSLSPSASFVSKDSLEKDSVNCPDRENNNLAQQTFSGIIVQHSITEKGIKLYVTLQTHLQDDGDIFKVTAELKRYDRLREVKPNKFDSDIFMRKLDSIKQDLYSIYESSEKKKFCMGRCHETGKRTQWQADMVVVGILNSDSLVEKIFFYYEDEEYEINLCEEINEFQSTYYHSQGRIGEIRVIEKAQRLSNLQVRKYTK